MVKKNFSVDEICTILEKCRKTGVTRLQIGNLAVTLRNRFPTPKPKAGEVVTPTLGELAAGIEYAKAAFRTNEATLREQELSELRLRDPEAYEELVARGELTHVGEESSGIIT